MSRTVVLSFAPLAGENRVGELKKDDKGYYHDMVLGALGRITYTARTTMRRLSSCSVAMPT